MDGVKWCVKGLFHADCEKVYDEIKELSRTNNFKDVSPKEIVHYAEQNTDSELHKCFEWDNNKAAEKWRLQQARNIVVSIVVKKESKDNKEPYNIRVIQQSTITKKYKPIEYMKEDEYDSAIREAYDYFRRGKDKYSYLQDSGLQAIISMID